MLKYHKFEAYLDIYSVHEIFLRHNIYFNQFTTIKDDKKSVNYFCLLAFACLLLSMFGALTL